MQTNDIDDAANDEFASYMFAFDNECIIARNCIFNGLANGYNDIDHTHQM